MKTPKRSTQPRKPAKQATDNAEATPAANIDTTPAANTDATPDTPADASAEATPDTEHVETAEEASGVDVSPIEEAAQYRVDFTPSLFALLWEAAELIRIGAKKNVSGVLLMPEFVKRLTLIVSKTGTIMDRRVSVMFNKSWDNLRRQIAAYVAAHCNEFLPDMGFRDPCGKELGWAYDYLATNLSGPFTDVDIYGTIFASDKGKVVLNLCQILAPSNAAESNCAEYIASLYAGNEDSVSDGNAYWRRHCGKEHVELLRLFKAAIDERRSQASPVPPPAPTITPAAPPSNNAPTVNAPTVNVPASTTPPTPRQANKRGKAYPEGTDELMAYVAAIVIRGEEARGSITYDDQNNLAFLDRLTTSKAECDKCAELLYDLAKNADAEQRYCWNRLREVYQRLLNRQGDIKGIVPSDGEKVCCSRFSAGVRRYLRARNRPKKPQSN